MNTLSRRFTPMVAACVLSLGAAVPAAAQTREGYNEEGAVIESQAGGGERGGVGDGSGQDATVDSGSLPFTGLDLGLIAGSGVLLLGAGVGMRRLTRDPQPGTHSAS